MKSNIYFLRCQCKPGNEGEFCQNSKAIPAQVLPPKSRVENLPKSEKSSSVAKSELVPGVGVRPAEGEERHPAFPEKLGNPLEKLWWRKLPRSSRKTRKSPGKTRWMEKFRHGNKDHVFWFINDNCHLSYLRKLELSFGNTRMVLNRFERWLLLLKIWKMRCKIFASTE